MGRPYNFFMTNEGMTMLYTRNLVDAQIRKTAKEAAHDLHGDKLTIAIILLGAISYGARLHHEMSRYFEPYLSIGLDAMGVSSYDFLQSNGQPRVTQPFKKPEKSITGRNILVAEDIIHTGHTLADTVLPYIWSYDPLSVSIATMTIKDGAAEVEVPGKIYSALHVNKDDYVIGEFLDAGGDHRGLKGIWKINT